MLKNGEEIKLILLDAAGQERYHSIASSCFKVSNGAVIAFDLTDKRSFDNILKWLNMIKEIANCPIALFGCKCDLIEQRKISKEEIEQFSKEYNLHYFETSSLQNYNVKESIETFANEIYEYLLKKEENTYKNKINNKKEKKSKDKEKSIIHKNTNIIEKKNIIGFENDINSKRNIGNELLKYDKLNKYLKY